MLELLYRIGEFDYRLDVLIEDIKHNKISIYNVPICEITAQFNSLYNEAREKFEVGDLTFFYRNTAELLFIKILRLLPVKHGEYDDDEEKHLQEQVINALEKLKFSQYAELLDNYRKTHAVEFNRDAFPFRIPFSDEDLLADVRLNDLSRVYMELMRKYGNVYGEASSFTFNESFNDEMKRRKRALLAEMFEKRDRVMFSELVGEHPTKELTLQHITMAFLAVVEAVDDGTCDFEQEYFYADICLIRIRQDLSDFYDPDADRAYDELVERTRELSFEDEEDDYSLKSSDGYDDADDYDNEGDDGDDGGD